MSPLDGEPPLAEIFYAVQVISAAGDLASFGQLPYAKRGYPTRCHTFPKKFQESMTAAESRSFLLLVGTSGRNGSHGIPRLLPHHAKRMLE